MKKIAQSNFVTYKSHRADPYFDLVKNGQKTIEGRIRKGEYRLLKAGDHIVVCNEEEKDSVEVVVKGLRNYESIREMLEHEPLTKILPNVDTVDQGAEIYKQFYTEEQQQEFGVIAIEVERLI